MQAQFGLIGKKLGHSFSKKYFSKKFADQNIKAAYELYELAEIREFPNLLAKEPGLKGLNVTIPYKQEVIPYLDRLGEEAEAIGAVNTISITPEGLIGNNSDIFGFWTSLMDLIGNTQPGAALILGTGGASKAVEYVLKERVKVSTCLFVSRMPVSDDCVSYADLKNINLNDFPLIVNTTPLGMYPYVENCPDFPFEKLSDRHYVMDLIYNPEETKFLRLAKAQGAKIENGMPMLIQQAEKSWRIWNGE